VDVRHHPEFVKWARRLGDQERAQVARKLRMLEQHGVGVGMPLVRRLDSDLWELRVGKHRLYFSVDHDTAVFHVYGDKGSQRRDIDKARERM
jgi:mRNA-degrading endonuclease RelE of RelBE toxin-antitoxin system